MFHNLSGESAADRSRARRRTIVLALPFLTMVAFAAGNRLLLDRAEPLRPVAAPVLPGVTDPLQIAEAIAERRVAAIQARNANDPDRALALCQEVAALEAKLPGGKIDETVAPSYVRIAHRPIPAGIPPHPLQPTGALLRPE